MINLDQVRTLEWKVKQAVQLIVHLRRENDGLRGRLSDTEIRLQELESLLEAFKATQNEMESGIRSALEELDNLEEASASEGSGPVDALSYPPADHSVSFVEEPSVEALDEPEIQVQSEVELVAEETATAPDDDRSFEEEYAALAAAEAASQSEVALDSVPESVELEVETVTETASETTDFFPEPARVAPVVEQREPEQPGLGIF